MEKKSVVMSGKDIEVTEKPIVKLQLSSAYGHHDSNRSTGRTFRILLASALSFSEGKSVVIVAFDAGYANALRQHFLRILSSYVNPEYIKANMSRMTFIGYNSYSRRYDEHAFRSPIYKVFFDHYRYRL